MRRRFMTPRGGAKANVGDIAYKTSGGSIKVVAPDAWDTSLGTPVGVVVIPSGFAPDNGKARIINLNWTTGVTYWPWSNVTEEDTGLINYTVVPNTDNAGSTATGFDTFGYLPSDKFTGSTSYVDGLAKYSGSSPKIPSPYLGDMPNPAYYAPIEGYNNALADFDGKGNTDVLVGLGVEYVTANAARNYKAAGAEEIEWYLPAAGELGYLIPRFNKIQDALTKVNALQLNDTRSCWSSSEYSSYHAYAVEFSRGLVVYNGKGNTCYIRPFAQLDF